MRQYSHTNSIYVCLINVQKKLLNITKRFVIPSKKKVLQVIIYITKDSNLCLNWGELFTSLYNKILLVNKSMAELKYSFF